MNRLTRRVLPLAISILLAACAGVPSQAPRAPAAVTAPTDAELPAPAATVAIAAPVPTPSVWDKLRSSFAMPDCNADPSVLHWAKRYTHNPKLFERNLRQALPRLVYVQHVAAQYRVAGEFALLPWVESHFRPVAARGHHAAGMWQIMPITARSMGLHVDRHYDGRLDMPLATHAVMKLLEQYHDRFNDWRVADYAYNAGEFKLRKVIRERGIPADEPVIPDLPVRRVTREHLIKLMAMACVVREPERFQVSLPVLPDSERLVQTPMTHSMTFARAAELAGMSVAALRSLNAAFGGDRINAGKAPYLMLPASRADLFRASVEALAIAAADQREVQAAASKPTTRADHRHETHVVRSGESLWQIARDYATTVRQLEQLNGLTAGNAIQPGQVLQLDIVN